MRILWAITLIVTMASLGLWAATDFHAYTKYEVVERVPVETDSDDPFAGTGLFEDGEEQTRIEKREEFHFGFLPTPQSLFDKHVISVMTFCGPLWALAILAAIAAYFRKRSGTGDQSDGSPAPESQ